MVRTTAVRLLVYLTEDDRVNRRALYDVVVERAMEHGMAGTTVWRGIEGFGSRGSIRTGRFPDALFGLPIAVELIDAPERIDDFVPVLRSLAPNALVTREPVLVVCGGNAPKPAS